MLNYEGHTMNTMNITSAKYVNYMGQPSNILAVIDGQEWSVPLIPGNRYYDAIIAQGIEIEPYVDPSPTKDEQEALRQSAYAKEADPLYFKWQAGESSQEAWVAKRAEIKLRHPYPELE
jgi:hypothetical protein